MSGEASGAEAYLYVISCRLELAKIGVASDAQEATAGAAGRLARPAGARAHLALCRHADAVVEELYRSFAERRARGKWYRVTAAEVRHALGNRATLEAPAHAIAS